MLVYPPFAFGLPVVFLRDGVAIEFIYPDAATIDQISIRRGMLYMLYVHPLFSVDGRHQHRADIMVCENILHSAIIA